MARLMPVLLAVLPLAIGGASDAGAQANCQPTLTQPCTKPQTKPTDQRPAVKAAEEPIDHSKRIRIDKDTDLNFGLGGFGLGRRF
jgi:hypothetical protein